MRKIRVRAYVIKPKKILTGLLFAALLFFAAANIKIDLGNNAAQTKFLLSHTVAVIGSGEPEFKLPRPLRVMAAGLVPLSFSKGSEPEVKPLPDIERSDDINYSERKAKTIPSTGLKLQNLTSYAPDVDALFAEPVDFLPVKTNIPQVLIVHTHTSEGYYPVGRSDDESVNVVAIGDVIEQKLTAAGIKVIHSRAIHDTSYDGSYARSLETVSGVLESNPEIKIVIDVHRDAIGDGEGGELKLISEINGKTAAQYMLVIGTEEGGLPHPFWQENLKFGLKIQSVCDRKYPGLMRPINFRKERFNQHLAPGAFIVECGASGNTLEEAKYGAELFSDALSELLTGKIP